MSEKGGMTGHVGCKLRPFKLQPDPGDSAYKAVHEFSAADASDEPNKM